jgi:Nucleotidyltransferase domain
MGEILQDGMLRMLLTRLIETREAPLAAAVARADCYLVGSYAHGRADSASDVDIFAFTPDETGIVGTQVPFAPSGPRPGPGRSLATLAAVRSWRAAAGAGNVEIQFIGPEERSRRGTDLANWAFMLDSARLLHSGWGEGEAYRAAVADQFKHDHQHLAMEALVEFQRCRNQAQTTLLHGEPVALVLTAAMAARAALRAWLLWAGCPLPNEKWLPAVAATQPGAEQLLVIVTRMVAGDRSSEERFEDARTLRDLMIDHVRRAGGDPEPLWV